LYCYIIYTAGNAGYWALKDGADKLVVKVLYDKRHLLTKETYYMTKETYYMTKETYSMTKETYYTQTSSSSRYGASG
jgi:hypothetical protein